MPEAFERLRTGGIGGEIERHGFAVATCDGVVACRAPWAGEIDSGGRAARASIRASRGGSGGREFELHRRPFAGVAIGRHALPPPELKAGDIVSHLVRHFLPTLPVDADGGARLESDPLLTRLGVRPHLFAIHKDRVSGVVGQRDAKRVDRLQQDRKVGAAHLAMCQVDRAVLPADGERLARHQRHFRKGCAVSSEYVGHISWV
mmetsp:Transcript_29007/g.96319  ORF Transcript_29007/g.96319 Transcript_29007/m.96319 type:complete len:204 (-) Transcript_29007:65-676(-)